MELSLLGRGRGWGAKATDQPLTPASPGAWSEQGLKSTLRPIATPTLGSQPTPQCGSHLPLQQLLRPHVLGEEQLPGAVVGQRAVVWVVFKEGEKWNQGGWMKGRQALSLPTCTAPSPPRSQSPFLPARDGGCSPGSTWSSPAEGSGWRQGRS